MTNPDMVKIARAGADAATAGPSGDPRPMPEPNPPAPLTDADFARDPAYPAIDPPDSYQLKPMLD